VPPGARRSRLTLAIHATAAFLSAVVVLAACGSSGPRHTAAGPTKPGGAATSVPATSAPATSAPPAPPIGTLGSFQVGQQQMTFAEPAHRAATGQRVGGRSLVTEVLYPVGHGKFPLIMFAPGFQMCGSTYQHLLQTWASAGYVVAAVNFPETNCDLSKPYEADLVNQPADLSYVLDQVLALNAQPGNVLSGLVNTSQIAAAGQSDGGDTVAAMAANTCCLDHRLTAVAVLSGAEWPAMPGRYFPGGAPPMLFVQGSADPVNPPWTSVQLYRSDSTGPRYYLDLFGAGHMEPYSGDDPEEHLVARVTLAFFARYVLGRDSALGTMTAAGNVNGFSALTGGGQLPPGAG
jgi:dienelactone hydrolase